MMNENARPLPGALKLLSEACSFYVRHWQILVGISLIPVLFAMPIFWVKKEALAVLIPFSIISFLIDFISKLAFLGALTQNGGPEKGFKKAFKKGIGFFFPFLWVSILNGLVTLGGFVLFIIPGIMLSIWLSTSPYVLFAENRRGLKALTGSWHYVKGYWWAIVWRLLFLMILFTLMGVLLSVLTGSADPFIALINGEIPVPAVPSIPGQIINMVWYDVLFIPLGLIYSYLIYKSLKTAKVRPASPAEEAPLRKKVITFALIGLLFPFLILIAGMILGALKSPGADKFPPPFPTFDSPL